MNRLHALLVIAAITASTAFGQRTDLSGLKFCIDPGHGGHSSNDRPPVFSDIPFWESDGNFAKALLLKDLLEAEGATVILTRYTNDYINDGAGGDNEPSLTARWQTANANNVDWFHSIHSNAAGGTNTSYNYTMVLIKEDKTTRQAVWPQAITMSGYIYSHIRAEGRTAASGGNIAPGVYLDYTFYGGTNGGYNLGVLSGLAMPGELSEGSFHDYYMEVARLMNNSRRKMEAYGIRDAFLQYFGAPADTTGIIAGILSSNFGGKPINGCVVRLLPTDSVYTGDQYKNGFYMFDGLRPGTYRLRFETPGFAVDSADVVVGSGATVFVDRVLRSTTGDNALLPNIALHSPAHAATNVMPNQVVNLTFNKTIDGSSLISTAGNMVIREDGVEMSRSAWSINGGGRTGLAVWPTNPTTPWQFNPGKTYSVTVVGTRDAGGNIQLDPYTFTFTTANVALQITPVEPFSTNISAWGAPATSAASTGLLADSVALTASSLPRVPLGTGPASAKLRYGFDSTAGAWLLDMPLTSGTARDVHWTRTSGMLEVYVNGDASGTLFRFAVDDSVDAFPDGTPTNVEVSPWVRIDWVGWKLVEWNLATEAPGSWVGNGKLEGTLRLHGFQLSRDSATTVWTGTINLDQAQVVATTSLDAVAEEGTVPRTTELAQNFPNPFNPSTVIRYSVARASLVRLSVYDVLGREVVTLVNDHEDAGTRQVTWNASGMPSGIYYCRLQAGDAVSIRKMVLIK